MKLCQIDFDTSNSSIYSKNYNTRDCTVSNLINCNSVTPTRNIGNGTDYKFNFTVTKSPVHDIQNVSFEFSSSSFPVFSTSMYFLTEVSAIYKDSLIGLNCTSYSIINENKIKVSFVNEIDFGEDILINLYLLGN